MSENKYSADTPEEVAEFDETQALPTDEVDETRTMEQDDETRPLEQDSDLPELNFDPADSPSAFDPRVTGESGPGAASNASTPEADLTGNASGPTAEPASEEAAPEGAATTGATADQPTRTESTFELPEQAPSSWDELNPFEEDENGEQENAPAGAVGTQPGVAPEAATEKPDKSVKFGLLTWSLVMIVIGVAVIAMPWWPFIDWPVVGTATLAVMGLIMLATALISFLTERKSKKG